MLLGLGVITYAYAAAAEGGVRNVIVDPLEGIEKSLSLSPKDSFYTPTGIAAEITEDERSIENMSYADVSWVSSHNSHANKFASSENVLRQLASNQEMSVYEQLSQGVRGLMLDIEYRNGSLQCVHGFVEFSLLRSLVMRNHTFPRRRRELSHYHRFRNKRRHRADSKCDEKSSSASSRPDEANFQSERQSLGKS